MSDMWVHKNGPVTVGINRTALGFALEGFAPQINAVAEEVAEGARSALPRDSMRRFIGVKKAGVIEGNNKGVWRLRLRSRRYGSGTGDKLMRGVNVPVALVTNNSRLALVWEYGEVPQKSAVFSRKGAPGKKGMTKRQSYSEDYFRQYQPLTIGAMHARARLVLKRREARRG